MSTIDLDTLIDRYCEVWSQPNDALRQEVLGAIVTESVAFADAVTEVVGIDGLLAHIRQMRDERPTLRMSQRGSAQVDPEGLVHFGWRLGNAYGFAFLDGHGTAVLSAQGAFERISHAFGAMPLR